MFSQIFISLALIFIGSLLNRLLDQIGEENPKIGYGVEHSNDQIPKHKVLKPEYEIEIMEFSSDHCICDQPYPNNEDRSLKRRFEDKKDDILECYQTCLDIGHWDKRHCLAENVSISEKSISEYNHFKENYADFQFIPYQCTWADMYKCPNDTEPQNPPLKTKQFPRRWINISQVLIPEDCSIPYNVTERVVPALKVKIEKTKDEISQTRTQIKDLIGYDTAECKNLIAMLRYMRQNNTILNALFVKVLADRLSRGPLLSAECRELNIARACSFVKKMPVHLAVLMCARYML